IERLEPALLNKIVFNYRERANQAPGLVESVRTAGWILGCVSLLICAMSIFSTIALDTRARRKEIAVRKVNGAKSRDIYRMFGRVYLVMIVVSIFIAVPVCILFNQVVESMLTELSPDSTLSPLWPIILGISVVILLIATIVGWQIHKVMQVNPSKIIAKE
ncbi:MAG: FtsX-like permease family protein, partial [Muribaculaceae bacterium]|nr:FtsX-like permease family protein [Muribaculaceae bacterium]